VAAATKSCGKKIGVTHRRQGLFESNPRHGFRRMVFRFERNVSKRFLKSIL
jgi:hypothetical protein